MSNSSEAGLQSPGHIHCTPTARAPLPSAARAALRRMRWIFPLVLLALAIPADSKAQTAGVCGDGVVEGGEACDDGNVLDGDCCSSACAIEADGSACTDGDACTQSDTCQAGACVGGDPVVCTPIDSCHGAACDPATGLCLDSVMPDPAILAFAAVADAYTDIDQPVSNFGSELDLRVDGRPGRRVYLRFDVSGVAGMPVQRAVVRLHTTGDSPASSEHGGNLHLISDNGWDEAAITHENRPVTDGPLLASVGPVGLSQVIDLDVTGAIGADGAYSFVIEPASNNMAIYHSREAAEGQPQLVVTIYAPCDDGDACTQLDNCVSGVCAGTTPVICSPLDQCHDAGVCDSGTGICSNPEKADGTPCDDFDSCSATDACAGGICTGTGMAEDGTACDDGSACTQTDTCAAGVCVGSDPIVCIASGQCHDAGVCDSATGICSDPAKADGTPCDDDNACTQADTCVGGSCTGANPVICPAADQCHLPRTCRKSTGTCTNKDADDGTPCDDGNACTREDRCIDGECIGKNPVTCTALDACHVAGVCDPTSGECSNPAAADGLACDDRDACTESDACVAGACIGHSAPDSDGDGVCDILDLCRDFPDAAQIDADHDGIGDVCQCTAPAPSRCIPGGGGKRVDCLLELTAAGPLPLNRAGTKLKSVLACSDGDPACDVDGTADGQCTFGLALCFGNADPRFASCEPSAVRSIEVMQPKAAKSAAGRALEEALSSLGLEIRRRGKVVSVASGPVEANVCSPMIRVPVAAARKGKATKTKLQLRADAANGRQDVDQFVLVCK